jgi:peptidyl-prolyl cis-trans isomerase SurA
MTEEINISHILIFLPDTATAADTLKAWNNINEAYRVLTQGVKVKGKKLPVKETFETAADKYSEDNRVSQNHGYMGWITALQGFPYAFETVAYKTANGEVSKPFRTRVGYHIIKVNDRRAAQGEIHTAHIMVSTMQADDSKLAVAKSKIDSIYTVLKNGGDFAALATELSEDPGSARQNGELPWFGTGRMIPEFETAAFALKNTNDISEPVHSEYGWHIIKLLEKRPMQSFEEMKSSITERIQRDERMNAGLRGFIDQCKKTYKFNCNSESLFEFTRLLEGKTLSDSAFQAETSHLNKELFSFAGKKYSQSDFADYLKNSPQSGKRIAGDIIAEKFNTYSEAELVAYEDSRLEEKHSNFRYLMQEYHDGILLFEVSNREVWDKASKDSDGLKWFFDAHKKDYAWEKPHYKGRVIWCKDQNTLKAAKKLVKNLAADSIDKFLRTRLNDSIQYVKIEKGLFVEGDNAAVDKYGFNIKNADFKEKEGYPYLFVIGKILKNAPEDYNDVRGPVTADYQEFLESEWVKNLRTKYPVKINKDILGTVKEN